VTPPRSTATTAAALSNTNNSSSNAASTLSPEGGAPPAADGTAGSNTGAARGGASSSGGGDGDNVDISDMSYEERCAAEWNSVIIERHIGGRSDVYNHVHKIKLKRGVKDSPIYKASPALRNAEKDEQWVCILCKAKGKRLADCLRSIPNYQTTNTKKHIDTAHIEELKAIKLEKESRMRSKTKRNDDDKSEDALPQKQARLGYASTPKAKTKPQNCKAACDMMKRKIVKFMNNKALPDNTVSDPNFRDMIDFAINNAHNLGGFQHMGVRGFISIQCSNFTEFVDKVTGLISDTRDWWVKRTGARQPFISVGHDVWDGKRMKINGLTIFFINPTTLEMYRIPIALTLPEGEKSIELYNTSMHGLQRYGIEMEDIYRSANDNCRTARKTGRLILGGGVDSNAPNGCCDMHSADLFSGLALSSVKRVEGGVVVNAFPAYLDLYKKLKVCILLLIDICIYIYIISCRSSHHHISIHYIHTIPGRRKICL
jgi:hypothetical protein